MLIKYKFLVPSASLRGPVNLVLKFTYLCVELFRFGPLKSCIAQLKAALNEIEHSIAIEEQGFRAIVDGADVEFEEVRDKAPDNWYIGCKEAAERGLIAGVI